MASVREFGSSFLFRSCKTYSKQSNTRSEMAFDALFGRAKPVIGDAGKACVAAQSDVDSNVVQKAFTYFSSNQEMVMPSDKKSTPCIATALSEKYSISTPSCRTVVAQSISSTAINSDELSHIRPHMSNISSDIVDPEDSWMTIDAKIGWDSSDSIELTRKAALPECAPKAGFIEKIYLVSEKDSFQDTSGNDGIENNPLCSTRRPHSTNLDLVDFNQTISPIYGDNVEEKDASLAQNSPLLEDVSFATGVNNAHPPTPQNNLHQLGAIVVDNLDPVDTTDDESITEDYQRIAESTPQHKKIDQYLPKNARLVGVCRKISDHSQHSNEQRPRSAKCILASLNAVARLQASSNNDCLTSTPVESACGNLPNIDLSSVSSPSFTDSELPIHVSVHVASNEICGASCTPEELRKGSPPVLSCNRTIVRSPCHLANWQASSSSRSAAIVRQTQDDRNSISSISRNCNLPYNESKNSRAQHSVIAVDHSRMQAQHASNNDGTSLKDKLKLLHPSTAPGSEGVATCSLSNNSQSHIPCALCTVSQDQECTDCEEAAECLKPISSLKRSVVSRAKPVNAKRLYQALDGQVYEYPKAPTCEIIQLLPGVDVKPLLLMKRAVCLPKAPCNRASIVRDPIATLDSDIDL